VFVFLQKEGQGQVFYYKKRGHFISFFLVFVMKKKIIGHFALEEQPKRRRGQERKAGEAREMISS